MGILKEMFYNKCTVDNNLNAFEAHPGVYLERFFFLLVDACNCELYMYIYIYTFVFNFISALFVLEQ